MNECIVLGVQPDQRCIEAAFKVGGSWLINRIFHPLDPLGRPLNLEDEEQVQTYVADYCQANYGEPREPGSPVPLPLTVEHFVRDEIMQLQANIDFLIIRVNQRFTQVEADLNGAWWRRTAAWVKTNSSLLGGKHGSN